RETTFPFGTPVTYRSIVSSGETLPCSWSCKSSVPVNVLVIEPTRVCMSSVIDACETGSASPQALIYVPWGLRTPTIAPGVAATPIPAVAAALSWFTSPGGNKPVDEGAARVAITLSTSGTHAPVVVLELALAAGT